MFFEREREKHRSVGVLDDIIHMSYYTANRLLVVEVVPCVYAGVACMLCAFVCAHVSLIF